MLPPIVFRIMLPPLGRRHSKGEDTFAAGLFGNRNSVRGKLTVSRGSSLIVQMHPNVRRDLARLGQLDHMHRRRIVTLLVTDISAPPRASRSAGYRAAGGWLPASP